MSVSPKLIAFSELRCGACGHWIRVGTNCGAWYRDRGLPVPNRCARCQPKADARETAALPLGETR